MQYIRLLFAPRHWWSWWKLYGAKAQSYYKSLAKIEAATCPSPKIWWIFAKKSTSADLSDFNFTETENLGSPHWWQKHIWKQENLFHHFSTQTIHWFQSQDENYLKSSFTETANWLPMAKAASQGAADGSGFRWSFFFFAGAGSILFMEYDCIVLFMLLMGQSYLWILV